MAFKWTPNHSLMIGNIIQQLGTAFMDEDQLRKTEKGRTAVNLINKVASSLMPDIMAGEGGKSKPKDSKPSKESKAIDKAIAPIQPAAPQIPSITKTTPTPGSVLGGPMSKTLSIGATQPTPTPTNVAEVGTGLTPNRGQTTGSGRQVSKANTDKAFQASSKISFKRPYPQKPVKVFTDKNGKKHIWPVHGQPWVDSSSGKEWLDSSLKISEQYIT